MYSRTSLVRCSSGLSEEARFQCRYPFLGVRFGGGQKDEKTRRTNRNFSVGIEPHGGVMSEAAADDSLLSRLIVSSAMLAFV